ncbi:hypothetical protein I4U23_025885 [Adineta vaga]|nr:hypothetical protein I4U23_025885 [Adineta vaga]
MTSVSSITPIYIITNISYEASFISSINRTDRILSLFLYASTNNGIKNLRSSERLFVSKRYMCKSYNTNTSQWTSDDCLPPRYNFELDRYECECNNSSSFTLIWLPDSLNNKSEEYNSLDIASLVFQSISIISLIVVLIHIVIIQNSFQAMPFTILDFLPLISFTATIILFSLHITLNIITYKQIYSEDQTECILHSRILMFFVYFFMIFMFCMKLCLAYLNYLDFVRLFPQLSPRRCCLMIAISFIIPTICVILAVGLNFHSSFKITQLYSFKYCWFSHETMHYFFTIPICLFISINIIVIILIVKHFIDHIRSAISPEQSWIRKKQSILILLTICITQGIGWFLGPFLIIPNSISKEIFHWLFSIINGLEGLWIILLYIIIRFEHARESRDELSASGFGVLRIVRYQIAAVENPNIELITINNSENVTGEISFITCTNSY